MAGYSVDTILAPEVILERISRFDLPGTTLQRIFGWGVAQTGDRATGENVGNTENYDGRTGAYDIFDITRRIATGRVPAAASSRQKPQKVGNVQFTIPRSAETIPLLDEDLHNRRRIGGPVNELDRGGRQYIDAQEEYIAQRYANLIEFQTAAMLRGSYTFDQKDDDLEHRFTGGESTIDYQIPDANKTTLTMDGTTQCISATWATAGTDIPLDLFNINAGFVYATGQGLAHAVCDSAVWNEIVNNTAIHTQGGSANIVFESIDKRGAGEFSCILRSIPWLTWHVVDYGLDVWDGSAYTWTKLIPANTCTFFPEPDRRWCTYLRGGEWVTEGPNGIKEFRYGFYPFSYPSHDPSGWNLCAVHNGFPALKRPKAIAHGTVVF